MFINHKSFTTNLSVILTVIMPLTLSLPLILATTASAKPHPHKEYKQNQGRSPNHARNNSSNIHTVNNNPVNYPINNNPVNYPSNNYPVNYPVNNYPINNPVVNNPVNNPINNPNIIYPGSYPINNPVVNNPVNYPVNNSNNYPNNNNPNNYARIPAGTVIPVTYQKAEKVVIAPDESLELELTVTQNIISGPNSLMIPAGSKILGKLQPTNNGTEYIADTIILTNGQKLPISAFSKEVTRTKKIEKGADVGDIGKGAVIGAAAATALSAILGDQAIATEEVLGGLGIGAIAGVLLGREKVEVIVIYPKEDLTLTLANDFSFNY
ncbi:MAG: hypothetical protein ACRC2J_17030 [Microcoleaceae cyanobacterium]